MSEMRPPRMWRRLLGLVVPPALREEVLGDLEEEFRLLAASGSGRAAARAWYRRQALQGLVTRWPRELGRIAGPAAPASPGPRRSARALADLADGVRADLVAALRGARRSLGSSLIIVLTFALGIGANLTVFRVIDRALLQPPGGIHEPDRVVRLFQRIRSTEGVEHKASMAFPDVTDLDGASAFEGAAAYAFDSPVVGAGASAERLLAGWATFELFPLLGVVPAVGRFFAPAEDEPGVGPTAVLSWSLWQSRFGGDPDVVGRALRIAGVPHTVVGVAPRGFTGPTLEPVQVWLPLRTTATRRAGQGWEVARGWQWVQIVARLAPGVTRETAGAQVNAVKPPAWVAPDAETTRSMVLASLLAIDEPDVPLWASVSLWLGGVSVLVWLIAAANVTNLLLAREFRRRRETAVRLAIGIGVPRLLRAYAAETLVLAALASAAALLVASWSGAAIERLLLPGLSFDRAPPLRLALFTLATCCATALVAAVVPALQAGRRDVTAELKAGVRAGGFRSRLQDSLVILQASFSAFMLVFAGLFVRSSSAVESAGHVGFETASLLVAEILPEPAADDPEVLRRLARSAVDRVERLPWAASAVVASQSPFAGSRGVQVRTSEGSEPLAARAVDTAGPDQVHVGPRYFETLGLPILEGRGLETADDRATSAPVAVVSASMARAFWRGESPVGACLWIEAESVCTRVVGVSGDVRWNGLGSPASLIVYLPAGQRDDRAGHVLVRTTGEPSASAGALRREIQAISADIRFVGVRPLVGIVASEAAPWRLGATLGSVFGGLASSVAMLGLYGLISFRVAQGRREIAIRGALGAPRPAITRRVLADGMGLLATGLFGGLLGAVVSSRWVAPFLVDVPSRDPSLYGIVTIALLVAGALACALPAYRATRVDPGVILRSE